MNAQESFEFFVTQMAGVARGLEVAKSSGNLHLAAMNFRQMFEIHLMCGLIKWRQRENPTSYFEDAVRSFSEAAAMLSVWSPSFKVIEDLPVGKAYLLAGLIGVPLRIGQCEDSDLSAENGLDCLLASADCSSDVSEEADLLIAKLRRNRRAALAAEIYKNYFDILFGKGRADSRKDLIKKGDSLFIQRACDAFFSGGDQTEGGGLDNALVVDYRLATVLKKVGGGSDSIHEWVW